MKTKRAGASNLVAEGKECFENTNEFKSKVEEIKKDMRDKYSQTLLNEKSWMRRIFIVIRRRIEIRRRISELSSLKKLYL